MTLKPAAEAAREFMKRVVAFDWAEDGEAERDLAALITSREDAVREEEREACAKVALSIGNNRLTAATDISKAIRARGGSHEATTPNAET